jgi:hypothetical protein
MISSAYPRNWGTFLAANRLSTEMVCRIGIRSPTNGHCDESYREGAHHHGAPVRLAMYGDPIHVGQGNGNSGRADHEETVPERPTAVA